MALCVQVVNGALSVVGDWTSACQGYAIMNSEEYASTPTLAALFAMPGEEDIKAAFMAGITLPLMLWLVSWAFGVVVGFINSRSDVDSFEE